MTSPGEFFAGLAAARRGDSSSTWIIPDGRARDEDELEVLRAMSTPKRTPVDIPKDPPLNLTAITTNMLEFVKRGVYRLRERVAAIPEKAKKHRTEARAAETLREKRDRLKREIAGLERRRGKR